MKPTFQPLSAYITLQLLRAATLSTLFAFWGGAAAVATNNPNLISPGNGLSNSVLRSTTALHSRRSRGFAAFGAQNTNALNLASTQSARQNNQKVVLSDVGPNHRSWTRLAEDVAPAASNRFGLSKNSGAAVTRGRAHQVVELTTGMNYWDGKQWLPSDATFELTDDAFVASRVQHQTRLNADLNVTGAVTTTLLDGTTLRSTPVAIALYDPNDGRFAVISTLTNCAGILVESNQVLYPDAFNGAVCASVIYTLQKGSFEQDVVITGRLDPLDYSFPTNAQIQVVTEFYDAPQPEKLRRPIYIEEKENVRRRKVSPDLVDEVLGFSDLVFGTGRAYTMPSATHKNGAQTIVAKEFKTIPKEGRTYLIETMEYLPLQSALKALPECGGRKSAQIIRKSKSSDGYAFIPRPHSQTLAKAQPRRNSPQLAQATDLLRTGVVVDYLVNLGGTLSSGYTFKGDATYLVSGTVYCNGPVTLESAVIKYKTGATIMFNNAITCKTASYRPAIFTGLDDDSVGESLFLDPDWTGNINPAGYANPAVWSYWYGFPNLNNVRFCYAQEAIRLEGAAVSATISDAQIVNCIRGIVLVAAGSGSGSSGSSGFNVRVNNTLFAFIGSVFVRSGQYDSESGAGFPTYAYVNHCTIDSAQALVNQSGSGPSSFIGTFKNSILANIGSLGNVDLADLGNSTYNGFHASPLFGNSVSRWTSTDSPFQASAGGAYYLKGDAFRGKGTPVGLPSTLLPSFKTKTTQPPIAFPRFMELTGELTLFPQIPRYVSGPPDLGYYYDVLDYTVAALFVAGGTINVMPGTAVGFRNEFIPQIGDYTYFGFDLWEGSSFTSHGLPTDQISFTDVQLVQEGFQWPIFASFQLDFLPNQESLPPPNLSFRFANFYLKGDSYLETPSYHVVGGITFAGYEPTLNSAVFLDIRDCNFYGGQIDLGKADVGVAPASVSWINNLFDRVAISVDPDWVDWGDPTPYVDLSFQAYNNLFRGNQWFHLVPIAPTTGNWVIKDNLFDKVAFEQDLTLPIDHDYNGYWKCTPGELELWQTDRLSPIGANDVVLASAPAYQPGPLGGYYLPSWASGLYNAGSRTAVAAGLFHYTTQQNQIKEGSEGSGNKVNIGLHYVATVSSSNTQPKDLDNDGIPDYVEDQNGDGVVDPNETSPSLVQTSPPTVDSLNAVYDNVDLDGDGMVGRVEKALFPANPQPKVPNNPLTITQVSQVEPGIFGFEIPINYGFLGTIGEMNLNLNGADVTMGDSAAAGSGMCQLVWNSIFDPAGQNFLQPQLALFNPGLSTAILSATGPILPFYSDNVLQFSEAGSSFDGSGAYLDAKLPVADATYTIELYDPSAPATPFRTIGPNTTGTGSIEVDWNVTYADDTTPFTGDTVNAVFNVTLLDGTGSPVASGSARKILKRPAGALTESGPNFNFAYMYTPLDSGVRFSSFNRGGVVWDGFQAVVDILIAPRWPWPVYQSFFNGYAPPTSAEYPGFIKLRSDVTGPLLYNLTGARQFYCNAHGDPYRLSASILGSDGFLPNLNVEDVEDQLGNRKVSMSGVQTMNPYRFVFLDACETAKTRHWHRAFGIIPMSYSFSRHAARSRVGPQAYVGWANRGASYTAGTPDPIIATEEAKKYTSETLSAFYTYWMSGAPLANCIKWTSDKAFFECPLPVPGNEIIVVTVNQTPTTVLNPTSKIYVVGHSGLTVSGLDSSYDYLYRPPYQQ